MTSRNTGRPPHYRAVRLIKSVLAILVVLVMAVAVVAVGLLAALTARVRWRSGGTVPLPFSARAIDAAAPSTLTVAP